VVYKRNADAALASPSEECCWNELTLNGWFIHAARLTLHQHQAHPRAVCTGRRDTPDATQAGIKAAQPEAKETLQVMLRVPLSLGFKQKQRVMLTRQTQHFKNRL